jgi:hypothetical protein
MLGTQQTTALVDRSGRRARRRQFLTTDAARVIITWSTR